MWQSPRTGMQGYLYSSIGLYLYSILVQYTCTEWHRYTGPRTQWSAAILISNIATKTSIWTEIIFYVNTRIYRRALPVPSCIYVILNRFYQAFLYVFSSCTCILPLARLPIPTTVLRVLLYRCVCLMKGEKMQIHIFYRILLVQVQVVYRSAIQVLYNYAQLHSTTRELYRKIIF